ncbi:MAG: thioredoxin family protein [Polaribacter sp.]|nr:thioredoxin family protein [Polaribacter sp.]
MKKIVFSFIVCFLSSQLYIAQIKVSEAKEPIEDTEVKLNWMPSYKEALKTSKKEKKPVLIYFTGSDWCAPCKTLDEKLFHTSKFKALADKGLILLEVDIPRRVDIISADKMRDNKSIQKKYNVTSFPTLMIVNHRGKKLAEKKGYILVEYYYPFLQSEIDAY